MFVARLRGSLRWKFGLLMFGVWLYECLDVLCDTVVLCCFVLVVCCLLFVNSVVNFVSVVFYYVICLYFVLRDFFVIVYLYGGWFVIWHYLLVGFVFDLIVHCLFGSSLLCFIGLVLGCLFGGFLVVCLICLVWVIWCAGYSWLFCYLLWFALVCLDLPLRV